MTAFDAELYLRLKGEESLLDPRDTNGPPRSPIADVAAALVAIGAIEAAAAQEIVNDYGLAAALRSNRDLFRARMMRQASRAGAGVKRPRPGAAQMISFSRGSAVPPTGLGTARPGSPGASAAPRVVPCDRSLELASGTLHVRWISLADDGTAVAIRFQPASRHARRPRPAMVTGPRMTGHPPQVTLTDDTGTAAVATFSGGGGNGQWEGQLRAQPLARDTTWIELDGNRIDLVDRPVEASCVVEPLAEEDPALAHLWRYVASPSFPFRRSEATLSDAIDAIVAAGALAPDEPALDHMRAVTAAFQPGPSHASPSPGLPEPWRSLLARAGRTDGPNGSAFLGVTAPEIDGITVSIMMLESGEDGFDIQFGVTPSVPMNVMFDDAVEPRGIIWWAADDRGNHYLGQMGAWSGGGDHASGTVNYWPAIDPRATRLDLMPTAKTTRAVISVPLAWAQANEGGA